MMILTWKQFSIFEKAFLIIIMIIIIEKTTIQGKLSCACEKVPTLGVGLGDS